MIEIRKTYEPEGRPDHWIELFLGDPTGRLIITQPGQSPEECLDELPASPDWREERIDAYGSWRSQMDMMAADAIDGGTRWRDHVAAVKASIPKPDEV